MSCLEKKTLRLSIEFVLDKPSSGIHFVVPNGEGSPVEVSSKIDHLSSCLVHPGQTFWQNFLEPFITWKSEKWQFLLNCLLNCMLHKLDIVKDNLIVHKYVCIFQQMTQLCQEWIEIFRMRIVKLELITWVKTIEPAINCKLVQVFLLIN